MAASSSKPTAVHFTLVFFVLVSLVFGLLYYVEKGSAETERKKAAKANEDKGKVDTLYAKASTDLETLNKLLFGATAPSIPEVGSLDQDPAPGTVLEKVHKDQLSKMPLGAGEKSIQRFADAAAQENKTRMEELVKAAAEKKTLEEAYKKLEATYNENVAKEKQDREKEHAELLTVTKNKDEIVAKLNADIQEVTAALSTEQTDFANFKLATEKEKKAFEQKISRLSALNQTLNERIEILEKGSFEVPSGEVRYVDTQNKLVYINLGESDLLPKRTTFSVYTKSHSGIARGPEDIKGSIEVSRIIDAHTAECRITKENIFDPISMGDPIYTPLWFPGQPQRFALIGTIDLDGDGQDDRPELHEFLKNANAIIDSEVLNNGDLQGAGITPDNPIGITERTKFMVLGALPELSDVSNDEEKAIVTKINGHLKAMRDSAREYGVRVISLTDFLNYVGYKSNRRLFKPGDDAKYNLKGGAPKNPTSSGQTSGIYDPKKANLKPATANGTLNKLFKGGR